MNKKGALIIAIMTLMTVIAWLIFGIIHAREQVQIPTDTQSAIEPLDPNFDLTPLNNE
jgi:hypothetical protein